MDNRTKDIINKVLYVPVELYYRELGGAILLAITAALDGWKVVVGGKGEIFPRLDCLPKGVFFLKSVVPGETQVQKRIKTLGHKITSLDAEGLILSNGLSGVHERYSEESINLSDKLFFWGKEQYQRTESEFPAIKQCGTVTGSPVADYWKILKQINDDTCKGIGHKKNSKTILIATSFPWANHIAGKDYPLYSAQVACGLAEDEEYFKEIKLNGEMQKAVFPHFLDLVGRLAKDFPKSTIVLKPHPTENHEIWFNIASRYDNVHLQTSGSISNSLLESDVFVHFNSTASLEAYVYDKYIFTLTTSLTNELYSRLNGNTLAVSNICKTIDELVGKIHQVFNGDASLKREHGPIKDVIDTLHADSLFESSRRIIAEINFIAEYQDINEKKLSKEIQCLTGAIKYRIKHRLAWVMGHVEKFLPIFGGKYKPLTTQYKYGKRKQGVLDNKTVDRHVANIKMVLGGDISINVMRKGNIFIISQ